MTALAGLENAREQAWKAYDTIARAYPDCEHAREWRERAAAARRAHLLAIRACDKAIHKGDTMTGGQQLCRAHPDDCPNGPGPHAYHPPELEGLPCCRQPGEEVPL